MRSPLKLLRGGRMRRALPFVLLALAAWVFVARAAALALIVTAELPRADAGVALDNIGDIRLSLAARALDFPARVRGERRARRHRAGRAGRTDADARYLVAQPARLADGRGRVREVGLLLAAISLTERLPSQTPQAQR